ncbi:Mediator of RNA polymerase II transcription subunit 15a [Camellia lanceoleosa]|uniref:Mediator of RNA polymerase II transcription subunit 15a n=1 Tax=Camellia lanceoleosa TaxID=1840588 RepID=A0ACC0FVC8_9ERIC|nr:Mediator of RNA polymerase II transcription subunit 15a [Camellia lanceoleosa]
MFITVQDQQQTGQHQNATILQQNHHVGLLEKKQQLPSYQQNMSTPFNQSLGLQSNVSGLQQQKQFIGGRSDLLKRQPHQHALNVLQQPEVAAPQQSVHQTTQPMQLHQLMGLQDQSNSLQESIQKRHHNSAALLPQNGFIDQQKQTEQSQRVLPQASSASLDSTCQIECAALADWHDQAYRELESIRDMYLTEVIRFYKRIRELCLQPPSAELATKYEKTRIFMEKTIKFLEMPRADIVRCSKDKFYHYLKLIISYVNSFRNKNTVPSQQYGQQLQHGSQSQIPQLQQQINMKLQFHSMSPGLTGAPAGSPQLAMQQRIPNSQANKINLLHNGSLTGSEPKNAWSPLQHGSTHQNIVSRPQQTNIINALHSGSLNGMEQRSASGPLRHGAVRSLFPNMMSTLQQTNFSHMTTVNALDPTTSSLPSSSTNPFLNLKQEHKHQTMQAQTLKQPMQQPLIEQKKQQKFMQKIYEVNEPKVGRVIGFSSGVPQQYHSVGQQMEYSPQYFLPSTPHMNVGSPQTSQHSSPHIDQKNLLSPLSRAGTPLQSAASPFVVPSPSTPLTPSSLPLDPEIHSSGISPLSVAENTEHPQTPVGVAEINPKPQSKTNSLPLVKSVSPRALSASVRDIGLVINTIDRIAGTTTYDEFGVAISDDLAADISHCLQGRNFSLDCEGTSSKRKRHISTTASDFLSLPLNENDGLERLCCQTPDVVSTATSRIKRPRIELNDALLDEIKEINQKLVETVIDVISDSTEYAAKGGFGEGTIVRCSYSALGLGGNFKQQYSSSRMLSILPVQLLVPADYPNSSPILVNTSPIGKRDAKELENLSERARLRFSLSLCELSQPMSLGEMARTWDVCARTVLSEFAQSMGGGSFSTTYGTWENCITAS